MMDIVLGNIPGFELLSIPGESTEINQAFQNLTPTGGLQTLPIAPETWEMLSTDTNDSSSGAGARTVAVVSLDENHVEQTTLVSLNGTTPVTLGGTHLRSRDTTVVSAGSDPGNTNIGDLIVRVSGGGTERLKIPAGVGDCKSLIFTIPANKTAFVQNLVIFCQKNRDGTIRPRITPFGGATIESAFISTFQNGQSVPISAPIRLEEKTDITVDAISNNANTRCLVFFAMLLVDNEKLT